MQNSEDIKNIVNVVRELVHGYYVIVYADTGSYSVHKYNRTNITEFLQQSDNWIIKRDGDVAMFILMSDDAAETTSSELVETFNSYTDTSNNTKMSRLSLVCDASFLELIFDGKQPEDVLKEVSDGKIK